MVGLDWFPLIEKDQTLYYGGDQAWFHGKWQREAGCASVCAANLAAYDQIGITSNDGHYKLDIYLQLMNDLYHCMTPGINGYPHARKFADAYVKYAEYHGRRLVPEVVRDWADIKVPKLCLFETLSRKEPAALLVLLHKAPKMEEYTWHWMAVSEFDDNNNSLTVSSHGRKEKLDVNILLKPDRANQVRIVTFHK